MSKIKWLYILGIRIWYWSTKRPWPFGWLMNCNWVVLRPSHHLYILSEMLAIDQKLNALIFAITIYPSKWTMYHLLGHIVIVLRHKVQIKILSSYATKEILRLFSLKNCEENFFFKVKTQLYFHEFKKKIVMT